MKEQTFFDVQKAFEFKEFNKGEKKNFIRSLNFYISDIQIEYLRTPYTFLDVVSNVGGLAKGLILLGLFVLCPFYFKL